MADKVLIVDDDPSICKLLEKVMHSNDLETTVADRPPFISLKTMPMT